MNTSEYITYLQEAEKHYPEIAEKIREEVIRIMIEEELGIEDIRASLIRIRFAIQKLNYIKHIR